MAATNSSNSWLTVLGQSQPDLEKLISDRVSSRIAAGEYAEKDVFFISKLNLAATKGNLEISSEKLERLRQLCQLFEIELRPARISSHRKIIGPVIVTAKKLIFPILQFFLKDLIRQQRAFNASVICLLTDLSNQQAEKHQEKKQQD